MTISTIDDASGMSWPEICRAYHFDGRINWRYSSDYRYDIACVALIDVDNTLTRKETLTSNWLQALYKFPKISKESGRIGAALKLLKENPNDAKRAFDEIFLGVLRKAPLTERMYEYAVDYAVENTAPLPGTREMMWDMLDRGVARAVVTYGLKDSLERWYGKRISVPASLVGTELDFRDGVLVGYRMGMGSCGPKAEFGKVRMARETITGMGYGPDQVISLDDDPQIDRSIITMLGVDVALWVDKDQRRISEAANGLFRYPGRSPVVLKDADKDMRAVTSYIDKWRRMKYASSRLSPSMVYAIKTEFDALTGMKGELDSSHDDETVRRRIRPFVGQVERVLSTGHPIVSRTLSGIDDILDDLRSGLRVQQPAGELKRLAEEAYEDLLSRNPESRLGHEYTRRIRQLMWTEESLARKREHMTDSS